MNVRKLKVRISVLSRQTKDGTVCVIQNFDYIDNLTFQLVFIAGNGGANPRHATLFATDVPPSKAVRIIDRYLMFYIRTADKLMRTARWVESFEGGVEVRPSLCRINFFFSFSSRWFCTSEIEEDNSRR